MAGIPTITTGHLGDSETATSILISNFNCVRVQYLGPVPDYALRGRYCSTLSSRVREYTVPGTYKLQTLIANTCNLLVVEHRAKNIGFFCYFGHFGYSFRRNHIYNLYRQG